MTSFRAIVSAHNPLADALYTVFNVEISDESGLTPIDPDPRTIPADSAIAATVVEIIYLVADFGIRLASDEGVAESLWDIEGASIVKTEFNGNVVAISG